MKKLIVVLALFTAPAMASLPTPVIPSLQCNIDHIDWEGNVQHWTVNTDEMDTVQEEKGDWHFTKLDEEMPVESIYIDKSTLKGVIYTREPSGEIRGQGKVTCIKEN